MLRYKIYIALLVGILSSAWGKDGDEPIYPINPDVTPRPVAYATPITGEIIIDGLLEEIEWEEYAKKFAEKYGDYRKWLIDYRKSTLDDYVEEEEKVA